MKLYIDQHEVNIEDGATILQAAEAAGVEIPTLCHLRGHPALTSCFVCVVKVNGGSRLLPACATRAAEGMRVESDTPEVHEARKTAFELLLSDHLGDCIGPCQSACPAHMDIPAMIRAIADGRLPDAIAVIKEHIALPAVLGRICPEICERACRRAGHDAAVSICALKRFAADADLASGHPYNPPCKPPSGKQIAIIGAGPAGLAAAYYLLQRGHQCTLFDAREEPGGMLRYAVEPARLPREVLAAEIDAVKRLGVIFRSNTHLGSDIALSDLQHDYDAVLLAIGEIPAETAASLGLPMGKHGLTVDRHTLMTAHPGLFAAGSTVAPSRHAVRAVAAGRHAALAIDAYLRVRTFAGNDHYTVHMGKLTPAEMDRFMDGASLDGQVQPAGNGFTPAEAHREAARCLHCDCRKLADCRLRRYAESYGAHAGNFRGERREYVCDATHSRVSYEAGKCITCGICVQLAAGAREALGLTHIGRGFDVRIGVPFYETLAAGLQQVAEACAEACPTGALAVRE